jgi:flavin-binding protein dodecin
MAEYEGAAAEKITGSSTESIQDAVRNALKEHPRSTSHRRLTLERIEVEEGGINPAMDTVFHVTLNPQPLPPGPDADLNPQPLPPEPPE